MKVSLLGATGRVGAVLLEKLMLKEFEVKVLVRGIERVKITSPALTAYEGNVLNESDLSKVIKGTDVVISALNTGGTNTLSKSTPLLIKLMQQEKISRIITIGTAGILQARSAPNLYRFQSQESKRKTTNDAEDHLQAYLHLKNSGLDWTIVCPTYLPVGERKGEYRFEKDYLPDEPSSISIYDTADFAYQQIFTDEFIGSRVGLTY